MRIFGRFKNLFRFPPVARHYMIDGLIIASGVNMVSSNNNIFTTRLGANDYQLSLVQFLPMMFNLLVLLPGGFLTDGARNKKNVINFMLIMTAIGYVLCAASPLIPGGGTIYFFLGFLSLAAGASAVFNISWQSFFPDVVEIEDRNRVFSLRTQMTTFTGMLMPLISGLVLSFVPSTSGKIAVHQFFYLAAGLLFAAGAWHFRKINAVRHPEPKRVNFNEIKKAGRSLFTNKPFVVFMLVAMFFYMTWHFDWTLYFIGQSRYLGMNEFMLGLVTVFGTGMQLVTIRFWSRKNEKLGVVLPITFGIVGLSICPLVMIASVSLPVSFGPYVFLALNTLANFAFATVNLNMFQCQLQVMGDENRSLALSVFSSLTCLSNAVMPVAGVALYKFLGDDLNALRETFALLFVLRLAAAGLWMLRWYRTKASVQVKG